MVTDWQEIERSADYRELVARRRKFVLPATAFFLVWYLGFILLAGYAEDFMGESVYEGLTIGYCLALTQFLMVAVLGVAYLRYSDRVLDPLRDRIVARAEGGGGPGRDARPPEPRGPRFERDVAPAPTTTREARR